MIYSQKELAQLVVETCVAYGIEYVIISPGSRNAPLTIGFTNHPDVKTYSIVDERCAAFFALGMSQQTQKPTALVCTSGSALLNYYPAFAEAFYSKIPLVVISADRPKHLIDVGDGQTIRQESVFGNHSLFNANLIENQRLKNENAHLVSEAIASCIRGSGPVHINVPFDEPLYETTNALSIQPVLIENSISEVEKDMDLTEVATIWNSSKKRMILVGTCYPEELLQNQLAELVKDESVLVLTETTSNLHHEKFVNSIDKLIFSLSEDEFKSLRPEVLITLGGMVVSKKIKQFLRKYQPSHHWHIDCHSELNTFYCLSYYFKIPATLFFDSFLKLTAPLSGNYQKYWLAIKNQKSERHDQFIKNINFSDLKVFALILENVPNNYQLQLGNSSVVRYSQLFDLKSSLHVFCNRGTSGIDGSTSTAIGAALIQKKPTLLITGDISFFYDSNALWNNYIKDDFRIIVINNAGGGIFRIIEGPNDSNALDYFETKHDLTAESLCRMHGIEYQSVKTENTLKEKLKSFYKKGDSPKLLEIFTPNATNDYVLRTYFQNL